MCDKGGILLPCSTLLRPKRVSPYHPMNFVFFKKDLNSLGQNEGGEMHILISKEELMQYSEQELFAMYHQLKNELAATSPDSKDTKIILATLANITRVIRCNKIVRPKPPCF